MNRLTPGQRIADKYRIVKRIGRGSAGTVYRAIQENVEREVAIKVLSVDLAERAEMIERFRREAYNISQLKHPNTVTLFDYGQTESHWYIVMELLEGETLGKMLRDAGALSPERAIRVLAQVLTSLAEAHGKGIVHRDLKPDNIFLADIPGERDFVKVLDFGIAKALGREEAQLTEHGMVFGTPSYMAPEQATGTSLSPSTDVYAAGLLFFEMLTGRMAFRADSMYALLNMQVYDLVPALEGALAQGPCNALIRRATEKKPDRRYLDASAFLAALREAFQWLDPGAIVIGGPDRRVDPDLPATEPTRALPTHESALLRTEVIALGSDEARQRGLGAPLDPDAAEAPAAAPRADGASAGVARADAVDHVDDVSDGVDRAGAASHVSTLMEGAYTVHEQIAPFEVRSPFAPEPPWSPREYPPLVGLDEPLEALEAVAWGMSSGAGGRLALVVGPPGVGKSRLLGALRQSVEARGQVCALSGVEGVHAVPMGGLLMALRGAREEDVDPDGDLSRRMDDWLHHELGPGQPLFTFFSQLFDSGAQMPNAERLPQALVEMLFACVEQLMGALGEARPALFCLDDLQETDPWTLNLIHYLTRSRGFEVGAFGFVVALRTGVLHGRPEVSEAMDNIGWTLGDGLLGLGLGALGREDMGALLRSSAPVNGALCDAIYELTGGNPGDALEALRGCVEAGEAAWHAGQWELAGDRAGVPPEMAERTRAQLDGLSPGREPAARYFEYALQWAAVLGPGTSRAVFDGALRRDTRIVDRRIMAEVMAGAVATGVLGRDVEREGVCLESAIAAALLRADFDADPARAVLHMAACETRRQSTWRDAAERDLQLGEHLGCAGRHHQAFEHFIDAAEASARAGGASRALRAWGRAVAMLEAEGVAADDPRLLIAQTSQALGLLRQGLHMEALTRLEAIEARIPTQARHQALVARARRLQGLALWTRGAMPGAVERLGAAIDDKERDSTELAECVEVLGQAAVMLGKVEIQDRCQRRLEGMAEQPEPRLKAAGALGLGLMLRAADRPAVEQLERAAALLDDTPACALLRAQATLALGQIALDRAELDGARACLEGAVEAAWVVDAAPLRGEALTALARCALDRGELERAARELRTAWLIADELQLPLRQADVLAAAAELRALHGDAEAARGLLDSATAIVRALGRHDRRDPHWRHALGRAAGRL